MTQGTTTKVPFVDSFSKGLGLVDKDLVFLNTLIATPSYAATLNRPTTKVTLVRAPPDHFLDLFFMLWS